MSRSRSTPSASGKPVRRWGRDISTPGGRFSARLHMHLVDHQFLRSLWTNLHEFAPGAWRANQPSPARLADYAAMGIRSVLSLRGASTESFALFEKEACDRLGLTLVTHGLAGSQLVSRARMLGLLDIFDRIEQPFLMHCKSGADRTGFAAALYRIHVLGTPAAEAAGELHWRYFHFRRSKSGVLDHALAAFGAAQAATGITLRDWLAHAYDPAALQAAWAAATGRRAPPLWRDS